MEKASSWKKTDETASITDIILDYSRYWKWFILSVAVWLIAGAVIILVTQKQYKSSLLVLLNEDKSSKSNAAEFDLEALGLLSTTNNIENEVAILSSPDLMRSVADTLNLQTSCYIIQRFRKTELYDQSPFYVTVESSDREKTGNIRFYIQKNGTEYEISGLYGDININEKIQALPAVIKPDDNTAISIKPVGKEIVEGEKYHVSVNDISTTVSSLIAGLSISPTSKSSSALNISIICNNTGKGAAALRELVKQYNEMNVNIKNEIANNTSVFIKERLKQISAELADAEDNVVDFKQQNQITDLSTEAQLFVQQTGQNEQKLVEVETQLNVISLIEGYVNDPANKYAVIPNIGISDAGLAQMINEYNNKLLNSEVQLRGMGEENPARTGLMEDVNNMRGSILGSLKNVKRAYNITKQDLLKQFSSTKSRILSVPQQERGLIEKVREQRIKENLVLFLMQKREETNLSIASTAKKARIIVSPQENIPPIAPKSNIIILSVLILGFLCPVVVIYIINLFRVHIRSRNELEMLSDVGIIGQIGRNEVKGQQVVVQYGRNSGIAEMFRSLRNNLNFVLKHKENRIVLVTSTVMGEGKTFISVNLAISFALSGKKVLLLGGDIRNPKLKDYVNLSGKRGLSDYLANDDPWRNYINKSGLNDNIEVMVAGTIPPNPNELLLSPRLKDFLAEAKEEYDFIIIDTAPVGLVSDTYLIDEFVDSTLYIVRENVTPKAAVNFMNAQKAEGKLTNMYLVLNDSYLDSNYNYKYGYGKAYGYGSFK
ncbi:MAG: polysaccharide biosynthesis tyrosine autokinase [Prevotella sp.]|jgi:capsular exopolysaccharide synthesis family protein|nr:polysaccharide biosynthesis tyrosine autokinase [Prevotella sp.]